MDQYQLSNLPSRYQLAQHFHSSLDEPNLDNVQAKLYAIRQQNYEMAQQFFQQKYGTSSAYDQYLQQSNMTDLKPPKSPYQQYQHEIDMREHLKQKAYEIQQQQISKIQQSKKGEGKITNKRLNSSKKNPWLQSSPKSNIQNKNHIRIISDKSCTSKVQDQNRYQAQYYQNEYQDPSILVQVIDLKKSNQHKEKGQFISEFKQYLVNKNRLKSSNKQVQSPTKLDASLRTNNNEINNSILAKSKTFNNQSMINSTNLKKSTTKNLNNSSLISQSNQNSPQQELVKKIFKTINSKKGQSVNPQYIEKIQLAQYLTDNQRILDVLNVGPEEVVQKLQKQLQTKDRNRIKFHQCLLFVYQLLGKQEEQKKLIAKHCFADIPEGCMLQPQVIKQFQKIFKILDKPCDLIVKRLQFIQRLALDPMLSKILNIPAVYEPNLDKSISLRRIFQRIEVQTLLCSEQDLKAKQYISWAQFMKYFQSGHNDRGKYDILRLIQSLKNEQKMGFADIPQTVYQVITQVLKKLDKGQQYFNTQNLIGDILINKLYEVQKYTFVRGKGNDPKSGNIPMETFEETLTRIKQTAPKYLSIKEFLQFFSMKGQPSQLVQEQLRAKIKANNEPAKVGIVQQKVFGNQSHEIDGYDSDPQFYNNSQLVDKKQFRKTFAQAKKEFTALKYIHKDIDSRSTENLVNANVKVTVPKPFKFQQRQKQRIQQKQREKLNRSASVNNQRFQQDFKFKAKQIPQKVKQVGLYDKMLEEDKKRIQDRRKCSMLLTLANQQPFSFYNRKAVKKTKEQRMEFQFKANPIPWYCSVNLLKKKQQKQINRNEKIARMAQQSLSKAKLPPRMQKDFQQKLVRKNFQQNKKPERAQSLIKAKQPPNFDVLHKQFQQALQRKRKQNKKTQIKQFNFSQIKRQKKMTKEQQEDLQKQAVNQQQKQQKWKQTLKSSIDIFASSTAKFDQQVEMRRKQREQKRKIQDKKQKQEQQRKKINQDLNKKLQQQTQQKKDNPKQQQLLQNKQKQMKQQDENFKARKAQWLANASKQPLLVQRPLKRDIRIQKMKKLHQISQNLKKNGIKGKQHDQYFKRDELLMLQDYEFMVKNGQKM